MVPKHNRIPAFLIKNSSPARFITHPFFSLKLRKNDTGVFRFGFIISKRVDKRAVARNSIKRRMQAALLSLALPPQGYDLLFFLKKEAKDISMHEFQTIFEQLCKKEHFL